MEIDVTPEYLGPKYLEKKLETVIGFTEFLEGRSLPPGPLNVFLEVSNLCNMSCFMCVLFSSLNQTRTNDITSRDRGFLQYEDIAARLEKIAPQMLSVHLFGYGEPTIHPHFRSFVEFFSRYEVMIDFFTNGMKLDGEFAKFLVEKNVFNVTFSFSGATREEYENVYLGGNFDTVTANIKNLADEKKRQGKKFPKIAINSIAFQHHVDKFVEFVELMGSLGVNEISVKPLQEYGEKIMELEGHAANFQSEAGQEILSNAQAVAAATGISLWVHPDLTSKEAAEIQTASRTLIPIAEIKKIAQSKKNKGEKAEKLPEVPSPLTTASVASSILMLGETVAAKNDFTCPEPFQTLYISQDGSVRPCCFWSSFSVAIGSIKKNSANEIWAGAGMTALQTLALQGRYPKKGCGHCIERHLSPFDDHPWYFIREYQGWSRSIWGENELTELTYDHKIGVQTGRRRFIEKNPDFIEVKKTDFVDLWDLCRTVPYSTERFHEYFSGQVDTVGQSGVWGWVLFKSNPDLKIPIEITAGGKVLARSTAYGLREDLAGAGLFDGRFGFSFSTHSTPVDQLIGLRVRIEGTDWEVPLGEAAREELHNITFLHLESQKIPATI
jgi:MoaA/NifB/PqqE/SkfB family radical SAM enzyme